jgi:hypothetical protein
VVECLILATALGGAVMQRGGPPATARVLTGAIDIHVHADPDSAPRIIALVAKHQLILATGHLSPAEGLMVLEEARRQGWRAPS